MSVPVLVVSGFLGAGKTSFINAMLTNASGRRIAAIVNDFGAINIDAALVETRSEAVIGLANGCVCCSLQGDLLRTIKLLLSRAEPIDHIVIEASGVADPKGIIEALMDPILAGSVRLNAVVSLVNGDDITENASRMSDPLWRAQVAAADFLAVNRMDAAVRPEVLEKLRAISPALVFETDGEVAMTAIILESEISHARQGQPRIIAADRFTTLELRTSSEMSLEDFQRTIQRLAPDLVRAKGILNFAHQPSASMVFQLVGRRATLETLGRKDDESRLVLIGERKSFDLETARTALAPLFPV